LLTDEATMATVALGLYAFGAAAGIVWRSWWQWHRTGSTGFRVMRARPGSAEWIAGLGFTLAVLIPVAAALLQLGGVLAPPALLRAGWIHATGVAVAIGGIIAMLCTQLAMGTPGASVSTKARQQHWCEPVCSAWCATPSTSPC
jgi:nicotinamide riboside transporter PnuC